ncbi:hypothetical protein AS9A_P20006 (plasmid) [Hoyosella subflava DQS3-9A1]|uniref:Secreted protein n=1 Tax=Hoyosella subflava (strain DSM 45089 / JCM 17490 / NBRC 109087 / DQS3-9A1) TaxID=443218 RepID=F6ESC9_HOYSD|nr:hypothetical protein AS9A_P20006 [Hoyosella subflava DQS3-9A1]
MFRKAFAIIAAAVVIPTAVGVGAAAAEPSQPEPLPPAATLPGASPEDEPIQPLGTHWYGSGYVTVAQDWYSHQQSFGTWSSFSSITGVVNARFQVRVLDRNGSVLQEQNRYFDGRRFRETVYMNHHVPRPAGSVCTTLWEGGHQLGTACEAIH